MYKMTSVRLQEDNVAMLNELCEKTNQSQQYHINCALYEYIVRKNAELEKINKILKEMKHEDN